MRRMSISSDASSAFDTRTTQDHLSDSSGNEKDPVPVKKRRSSESMDTDTKNQQTEVGRKSVLRMQLAQQLTNNTSKVMKKPMCVVRPAPVIVNNVPMSNLALDKRCIVSVFRYLDAKDLLNCALVCKLWGQYSIDPMLWKTMDFSRKQISSTILKAIVRRQPENLYLDWSHINKYQLPWLIARLTNLKTLSLISIHVKSAIALRSTQCSQLTTLDLSFISDFNDSALREILGPNNDSRCCVTDEKVRFRNLKTLKLAGTDVTDIAVRYITQFVPTLQHLSLSSCARITDAGIAQLSTKPANTVANLISLDLSGAKLITELSLEHLSKCEALIRLDCRHATQVTTQALIKFAAKSDRDLQVRDIKLVDRRGARS